MSDYFYGYKKGEPSLGVYELLVMDSNQIPASYFSMYAWALDNKYDLVIEALKGTSVEGFKSTTATLFFIPDYPLRFAQGSWRYFINTLLLFPELEEIVNKVVALEFLRST